MIQDDFNGVCIHVCMFDVFFQQSFILQLFDCFLGMRMMPEEKAKDAIKVIDELLTNRTLTSFRYVSSQDNTRILSGEEEGLFAWIAANYLAKAFDTNGLSW